MIGQSLKMISFRQLNDGAACLLVVRRWFYRFILKIRQMQEAAKRSLFGAIVWRRFLSPRQSTEFFDCRVRIG